MIAILIVGILIAMAVGRLGIYLVPKMYKLNPKHYEGVGLMALLAFWRLFYVLLRDGFSAFAIGYALGFFIPLVIGSYLIAVIIRTGTTEFEEAIESKELQSALIANFVLALLINIDEFFLQ